LVPTPRCAVSQSRDKVNRWTCITFGLASMVLGTGPYSPEYVGFRLVWLPYQARYVRVGLSRRAMHASYASPWHPFAKQHVLEACFLLMPPLRSLLLTP
jgi:hypothetical protein